MIVRFPDKRKEKLHELVDAIPAWLVSGATDEMADDMLRIAAQTAGFLPEEIEMIVSGQELI